MTAGNCKGRELEDQSSSAWGAVKRFARWGTGPPSELVTPWGSLDAAYLHAAIYTNLEFFHSSRAWMESGG